jgi:hypothetical protein
MNRTVYPQGVGGIDPRNATASHGAACLEPECGTPDCVSTTCATVDRKEDACDADLTITRTQPDVPRSGDAT